METKENIFPKGFNIADRFEIQFPIGNNSFAQSYRAKDTSGKIVRLDLINLASLPSSYFDQNGKLLQLNLLKQINHNNIPKLLHEGETIIEKQKFAFLAYEFVSGETLTERLKREGTLSPYTAIPIIIELLEAIEYLHNQSDPIIHNGINPNTLKLDYSLKRDKPILTGFEQARTIHQNGQSVSIKYLSVFHSAPELLNGIFIPQSDLFSIGAVLYHLLFGVPPFFNENILNQPINKQKGLLETARCKPLNFSLADDDLIDEQIKNTLTKALSIEIEDRFQTADEFSKALKREVILEVKKEQNTLTFQKKEKKPGSGFDAIAGMQELKDKLKNEILDLLEDVEGAKEYGLSIPNGMLLYGPPRCGKTFFAEKFAEEAGYNYKFIKSSDLASIYIHGSQEKIGDLFNEARKNAPMILCFDEIDALVPSRDKLNNASQSGEVNEFLTQLNNCGKDGVFVIGTTNFPQGIDTAVLGAGRLDIKVFVPVPDFEARKAMFKLYLKSKPIDLGIDFDKLAKLTENYASSDIVSIINQTGLRLRKTRQRIDQKELEIVISETIPSVSLEDIAKYNQIREKFENRGTKQSSTRKPLGFHIPKNE
ncbi:MAG: AAA family ATPase [Bacteroidales bacterium]|jgi:transitional endoplasmic reticulum ATPase|nr:AAA family ATPase [Bacteroidales bacterium]